MCKYDGNLLDYDYCYTISEIADIYGISYSTVWKWIFQNGLRVIRYTYPYCVSGGELQRFFEVWKFKRLCNFKNFWFYDFNLKEYFLLSADEYAKTLAASPYKWNYAMPGKLAMFNDLINNLQPMAPDVVIKQFKKVLSLGKEVLN